MLFTHTHTQGQSAEKGRRQKDLQWKEHPKCYTERNYHFLWLMSVWS